LSNVRAPALTDDSMCLLVLVRVTPGIALLYAMRVDRFCRELLP